jgi:hypothetical protein
MAPWEKYVEICHAKMHGNVVDFWHPLINIAGKYIQHTAESVSPEVGCHL